MVLANYCISKHIENRIQNPDIKPRLLFVTLKGDPKLAEKRISAIEKNCKYLTIDICGKDEAIEKM